MTLFLTSPARLDNCDIRFVMLLLAVPDFVCSQSTLTQNRPLHLVVLAVSSAGCAKPYTHKELLTTGSRCECVYKRTGEPSVTLCEEGGTVKQVIDFFT